MKIKNMKIYNTIQNSGTVMHFLDQNLKIKNGEQLNIMNEILWIYGTACRCWYLSTLLMTATCKEVIFITLFAPLITSSQ